VPCPLVYKGVLYLVKTGGIATSLNPKTGEVIKQARLRDALEGYYSSPVGADDKVYMISQAGKVSVLNAAGDWEILATNDLDEKQSTRTYPGILSAAKLFFQKILCHIADRAMLAICLVVHSSHFLGGELPGKLG